ncbi:MAG: LysM peptidoglycan-binding domain-containing protein [Thermoanaerobaculia bacterium]
MSFFKKDNPGTKPSFSNVSKGSSSTPATPQVEHIEFPKPTTGGAHPDFSNVQSGASSTAPTRESAVRTEYVVRSGDSLSKIAQRHYGDAKQWTRIYDANRDLIGDNPDLIRPGQKLVLPAD